PSVCEVLRLIAKSDLAGACSGRSAGFSPLRMRLSFRIVRSLSHDGADSPHAIGLLRARRKRAPRRAAECASNSRRPMVTVIRPSRARCVNARIPRHQRAVFTFTEGRSWLLTSVVGFAFRSGKARKGRVRRRNIIGLKSGPPERNFCSFSESSSGREAARHFGLIGWTFF